MLSRRCGRSNDGRGRVPYPIDFVLRNPERISVTISCDESTRAGVGARDPLGDAMAEALGVGPGVLLTSSSSESSGIYVEK